MMDPRDSPPLPHPPTMLHPALLVPPPQGLLNKQFLSFVLKLFLLIFEAIHS